MIGGTGEVGRNIRDYLIKAGVPLKFSASRRGRRKVHGRAQFSRIKNVTSEDYKRIYFQGVNKGRDV